MNRYKEQLAELLKNPIAILLAAELVWMTICSFTSEKSMVSFKYLIVRYAYVSTFFIWGYLWMLKEKKTERIYFFYALGMIIPIVNSFIFHSAYNFTQKTAYNMPKPFFADHTVYGACLAFILPILVIALIKEKKNNYRNLTSLLLIILIILFCFAIYFSFSRASWLSLAGCIVMLLLIKLKISGKQFIWLAFASLLLVMINLNSIQKMVASNKALSNKEDLEQQVKSIANLKTDISNKERINRWKCAIKMGNEKPWFGFGPRTYQFYYGNFQSREDMTYISTFRGNKGNTHSDYLSYFAEEGYLGIAIHLLLYLAVIYTALNALPDCRSTSHYSILVAALLGITTYMIHGLFNNFMEEEKMASLVYISMAFITFASQTKKEQNSTDK